MTKARRKRVNRFLTIIVLVLAMIGTAVTAFYMGAASMTPQAITVTHDGKAVIQMESGHIYEYKPDLSYRTSSGTSISLNDNMGYFLEK